MDNNIEFRFIFSFLLILLTTTSTNIKAQPQSIGLLKSEIEFNTGLSTASYKKTDILNSFSGTTNNEILAFNSTSTAQPSLTLFGNFGQNILDSFKGNNLYLHLAGIASTYFLVSQNVDYKVEHFFNQHEEYGNWARPVVISGALLPFVLGGSLYAYSKLKNDDEVMGASFAVLQASLIEFLYNSTLKAITGRPGPDWRRNTDMKALSKTFRFGFLRGGIFWGWPSGHTSSTMAVVSALTNYYPNNAWLKVAGYSLVAYTIFGVSSVNRGGMHWFSDAVAASFMAYAVGSTVGKYYRRLITTRNNKGTNPPDNILFAPSYPLGISFSFQF